MLGLTGQNAPVLADGTNKIYAVAICLGENNCDLLHVNGSPVISNSAERCENERKQFARTAGGTQKLGERVYTQHFECVSMDVPVWTRQ